MFARFFNRFEVQVGERRVLTHFGRRTDELFAFLLLHGPKVSKSFIAETLWPTGANNRNNLRKALIALKEILGPTGIQITWDNQEVLIPDVDNDVTVFRSAVGAGDVRQLLRVYRGPFLGDVRADWAEYERQRIAEIFERTVLKEVELQERKGESAVARDLLQSAFSASPLSDRIAIHLMRALASLGEIDSMARIVADYNRAVQSAGVDVSKSIHQLFLELSRSAQESSMAIIGSGSSPRRGGRLPSIPTAIYGRDDLIEEIIGHFSTTNGVTLYGPPGVGKSRLAVAVADQMQAACEDGARFIDFAGIRDASLIPDYIGLVLEEAPESRSHLGAITQSLQDKNLLFVFDNCEDLIEELMGAALSILSDCPGIKILLTSTVTIPSAVFPVRVDPLPVPRHDASSKTLVSNPCCRLFIDAVRRTNPAVSFDLKDHSTIAKICSLLEGLPLSISLIAAKNRVASLGHILQMLEQRISSSDMELLLTSHSHASQRHQSLGHVLDLAFSRLDPQDRTFLLHLSMFDGGWTIEAAMAIAKESEPGTVLDRILRLIDHSLVNTDTSGAENRFWLLGSIRQHCLTALARIAEYDAVRHRHLEYFASQAAQFLAATSGPQRMKLVDRAEQEIRNYLQALDRAIELGVDLKAALEMAIRLEPVWDMRGRQLAGIRRIRTLCQFSEPPVLLRAQGLHVLGGLIWNLGQLKEAQRVFTDSFELATEASDELLQVEVSRCLALVAYSRGDMPVAEERVRICLAKAPESGPLRARILSLLANILYRQGRHAEAEAFHQEGLALRESLEDLQAVALSTINIADMNRDWGKTATALQFFERAHQLAKEISDDQFAGYVFCGEAYCHCFSGNLDLAEAASTRALEISSNGGDALLQGLALFNAGHVSLRLGQIREAEDFAYKSLVTRLEVEAMRPACESAELMALVCLTKGQFEKSAILIGWAHEVRSELSCPIPILERQPIENCLVNLRERLGSTGFDTLLERGSKMGDDAVKHLLLAP